MRAGKCGIVQLSRKDFHGFRPALISAYLGGQAVRSGFSRLTLTPAKRHNRAARALNSPEHRRAGPRMDKLGRELRRIAVRDLDGEGSHGWSLSQRSPLAQHF